MGVDQLFHGVVVMSDGRKPGTPVGDFEEWIRGAGGLDLAAPGIQAMFRSAARRRVMEVFAEAGLPPMEVLKAATRNGAYALGRADQFGSAEPGTWPTSWCSRRTRLSASVTSVACTG